MGRADYAADFVVKEEKHCYDCSGDDRKEDPIDRKFPESHEEDASVWACWSEGCLDDESLLVECCKLTDVRHPNKEDDGDSGCVFSEPHSDVSMEERCPVVGAGKEDGNQEGPDSADDGVEERSKRDGFMVSL